MSDRLFERIQWNERAFTQIALRLVAIPYRGKHDVQHLLVDSTWVKMLGEGEWETKKHGADYRRQ